MTESDEQQQEEQEEENAENTENSQGPDYNYLLNMPMWFLTKEKKDELCKQRDAKVRCSAGPPSCAVISGHFIENLT